VGAEIELHRVLLEHEVDPTDVQRAASASPRASLTASTAGGPALALTASSISRSSHDHCSVQRSSDPARSIDVTMTDGRSPGPARMDALASSSPVGRSQNRVSVSGPAYMRASQAASVASDQSPGAPGIARARLISRSASKAASAI
jgi:hypothetical protein